MDFARFSGVGASYQGQDNLPPISSCATKDIPVYLQIKSLFPMFLS